MTKPRPLPASLAQQAFTARTARAAGVGRNRLCRADLDHPFQGVWDPRGEEPSRIELLRLRAMSVPDGHWFSHASAALLHGLWVPRRMADDPTIHLTTSERSTRRSGRQTRGHFALAGTDVLVRAQGLPVQSPADVWATMAGQLTRDELVVLGDQLVRRRDPWCTTDDLRAARRRRPGRRGTRKLEAALELVRPGTDSVKETELRLLILAWGLPEPAVNPVVCDGAGRFLAFGDLVWEDYMVIAEYDGEQHRTDRTQYTWDVGRLEELAAADWIVVRALAPHLGPERPRLRARLLRALRSRGWPGAARVRSTTRSGAPGSE